MTATSTAASTRIPRKTQASHVDCPQSCPHAGAPGCPCPQGGTSPLHGLDALQDEVWHRPPLPLTQRQQRTAKNLVWEHSGDMSTARGHQEGG